MSDWEYGIGIGSGGYGGPLMDGCLPLVDVDLRDESYAFSEVRVWIAPDGRLLAAYDSGCSCPTPFDGLTPSGCRVIERTEDLDPLIKLAVPWWWADEEERGREAPLAGLVESRIAHLKAKVHRALRDSRGRPLSPWLGYGR